MKFNEILYAHSMDIQLHNGTHQILNGQPISIQYCRSDRFGQLVATHTKIASVHNKVMAQSFIVQFTYINISQ